MPHVKNRLLGVLVLAVTMATYAQTDYFTVKSQRTVGLWSVATLVNLWSDAEIHMALLNDRNGFGDFSITCVGPPPGIPGFLVVAKFPIDGKYPKGAYRIGDAPPVQVHWLVSNGNAFDPAFIVDEAGKPDLNKTMDKAAFFNELYQATPPLLLLGIGEPGEEMRTLIFDLKGVRDLPNYLPCLSAP